MKTTATIFGALLMLSTAAAHGLGTDSASASPDPAATSATSAASGPASQPGATGNATTLTADQFRARLSAAGVDPDSAQGQVLMRWFPKIAGDPAWRTAIATKSINQRSLQSTPLAPDDRLRMLQLVKDMATESTKECRLNALRTTDFIAIAKTASPRAMEDLLEMMDILIQAQNAPRPQDQYTLVDLLNADARLNATSMVAPGTHGYPPGPCGMVALLVDAIDALPEPTRQYASFETMRTLNQQKTAEQVVFADPSAYLDDEFDERQLPDSLKSALPADGSRPLPFSRLTFDADWVNKTKPADNATFKDAFINRRNNGVIAEITTSQDWMDFTLSYGLASLRAQTVGQAAALSELGTLEDNATLAAAARDLVAGQSVDFAVPQPTGTKGMKAKHYEVGQSVPASTIFPSLTGTAVKVAGNEVGPDKPAHWQGVWLADYHVLWTQSIDDEDGHTEAVIRNVTIEGPSQ